MHWGKASTMPSKCAATDSEHIASWSRPAPLPQAARRLNNDFDSVYDDELLLEVERLNIDSASFVQMEGQGDVAAQILETVRTRGKQHNPVTGSGGMLLGRVARVGAALAELKSPLATLHKGDRVATLVSLTLTPLKHRSHRVGRSQAPPGRGARGKRCCLPRAWRRRCRPTCPSRSRSPRSTSPARRRRSRGMTQAGRARARSSAAAASRAC